MPHFENSPVKKIILVPAKSQNFSNSPWAGLSDDLSQFFWRGRCWLGFRVDVSNNYRLRASLQWEG
jgi:hypothetical protein